MNETRYVRKKRKRKFRKTILFLLVPAIIVFLAVATWGTYLYIKAGSVFSDSHEENGREKSDLRENKVDPKIDDVSTLSLCY